MSSLHDLVMRLVLLGGQFNPDREAKKLDVLNAAANRSNTTLHRMGDTMRKLNAELNGFSAVTKLAGMAGGMAVAQDAFRKNLDFHKNLLEMKQTAGMSTAQMASAKARFFDIARETLQGPAELLEGMRAFTSAGEQYSFAYAAIAESARAATAFFSTPASIASMDVVLKQKMRLRADELKDAHNMALYHARSGLYETKAMSMFAPVTLNTMASVGLTDMAGWNLHGALTQELMKLAPTTDPGEVKTYLEHFFGHLTSPHYVKGLASKGINIKKWMPGGAFGGLDASGKPVGGQKAVVAFLGFLDEMRSKGMADPFKMGEAGFKEMFTAKAAMQSLKNVESLREGLRQGYGSAKEDLVGPAIAEIKEASFGKVKAAEIEVEKMKLGDTATQGTGVMAGAMKWAGDNPLSAAGLAVGGVVGGRWLLRKGIPRLFGAGAEGATGALSAAVGQRVFVTNWPGGGHILSSAALGQKRNALVDAGSHVAGGALPAAGRIAAGALVPAGGITAGSVALVAGATTVAGAVGWSIGSIVAKDMEGTEFGNDVGKGVAVLLAMLGNQDAKDALKADPNKNGVLQSIYELLSAEARADAIRKKNREGLDTSGEVHVQFNLDGRVLAEAVNRANGADSRRQ